MSEAKFPKQFQAARETEWAMTILKPVLSVA
jgi:hypothetical protein